MLKKQIETNLEWSEVISLGYGFTVQFPMDVTREVIYVLGLRWSSKQINAVPRKDLIEKITKEFLQCKDAWIDREGEQSENKVEEYRMTFAEYSEVKQNEYQWNQ